MSSTPIQSIAPLWATFPTLGESTPEQQGGGGGIFADIFQSAIENVKQTEAEKNHQEYLLATGQLDNPADLTTALTKASMSVDLLIQLRNKALDAYSELNRINL